MKVKCLQRSFYRFAWYAQRQKIHDDPEVQLRRVALEQFREMTEVHGLRVAEAARLIGVSKSTLYNWRQRYRAHGLRGLRSRSQRPRRCPRKRWQPELARRLIQLRRQYPCWGKRKLTVLLHREGWAVSESTVGRMLSDLIRRGRVPASPRNSKRRAKSPERVWGERGWGGLAVGPGAVVQLDTMTVKPHYGFRFKQFTAVDVGSRVLVGELYPRATAADAALFLEIVLEQMPFPVAAFQVDGGGEFRGAFELACQARGIPLIVLPPHSPRMNTRVEHVHGICRREFYRSHEIAAELEEVRAQFAQWVGIYNRIRPHESLDLKTPYEFIGYSTDPLSGGAHSSMS